MQGSTFCSDFDYMFTSFFTITTKLYSNTNTAWKTKPTHKVLDSGRCITHAVLIHKELDPYKSLQGRRKKGQNFLSSVCIFLQQVKLNLHLYQLLC